MTDASPSPFHTAATRSAKYQLAGGSAELGFGAMFILLGAAAYLFSLSSVLYVWLGWILFITGIFTPSVAPVLVKKWFVWPRIGMAVPFKEPPARKTRIVVAAIVCTFAAGAAVFSLVEAPDGGSGSGGNQETATMVRWGIVLALTIWARLFWGIALAASGSRRELRWKRGIAIAMLVGLFVIGFSVRGDYKQISAAALGLLGAASLLSGLISLVAFVSSNPGIVADEHE